VRRTGRFTIVVAVALCALTYDAALRGQTAPPRAARAPYAAPRTPWGDPDLQGSFTNSDESLIPMERPDALKDRALGDITPAELASLNEQRNEERIEADRQRWELRSPLHWFENHNPKNSRAWLVVDPPDGKIPPQTAEARARAAARAKARQGRGEADSYEDRSLYDRCITRGFSHRCRPHARFASTAISQARALSAESPAKCFACSASTSTSLPSCRS
jgi:hypothetical protein